VQDALLQARIVADHFHLVRLTNDAVTRVQKRSVATNSGGTGGAYPPRVG
jgi:transposase